MNKKDLKEANKMTEAEAKSIDQKADLPPIVIPLVKS